jgi:raffinose/stachyose/melibiose transport system permease protein
MSMNNSVVAEPQTQGKRRFLRGKLSTVINYLVLTFVASAVLIPLWVAFSGGFKTTAELTVNPLSFPHPIRLDNFLIVINKSPFFRQLFNSLYVALFTVAINVTVSGLAAFVFARLKFPRRDWLYNLYTLGLLFPMSVAILPLFIVVRQLHLTDSLWGIILPQIAFNMSGNILILRNFFRAIPKDLEDAAYIDGCSPFGFFWRILLPLARGAIGAVAALTMVVCWNEFFLPLVILNKVDTWTLPLGTMQFYSEYYINWAGVLAFVALASIPVIAFYFVAERQIIAGLTAGAVKG